jgi:hypothetical protein
MYLQATSMAFRWYISLKINVIMIIRCARIEDLLQSASSQLNETQLSGHCEKCYGNIDDLLQKKPTLELVNHFTTKTEILVENWIHVHQSADIKRLHPIKIVLNTKE